MLWPQSLMKDFAAWWPRLRDLYFEGHISLQRLQPSAWLLLEHMDLINVRQEPFLVRKCNLLLSKNNMY